jgi:hypothetical protein
MVPFPFFVPSLLGRERLLLAAESRLAIVEATRAAKDLDTD